MTQQLSGFIKNLPQQSQSINIKSNWNMKVVFVSVLEAVKRS